jgi:multiple sugar transport system substrate-binding protein
MMTRIIKPLRPAVRHVLGATAVASSVLLLSCSSGSPQDSTDALDDPVTLTFWGTYGNGGNTAQTDVLERLIAEFEDLHPSIAVEYVDVPYDSLKQRLTTSAAGDELPDIVRADIGWVAQFGELGVFAALDQLMENFDELAATTYAGALATNEWNGHYYGLPLNTNTRVMITSEEALAAAGVDEPPATFEELVDMAAALSGVDMYVFADAGLQGWNILPWIWSGGGAVTDDAMTRATGHLDGDESVAAIQMLVDLYQDGQIPNLIIGNEGATSTSDGLPSGNYATILDGPWMRDIWAGQYPDFTPVYAPVPAGDGGSISVVGGESVVVTTTSPHQDAALAFVEFTLGREFQLAMAEVGMMPVVEEYGRDAEIDPFYTVFAEQLRTARPRLPIPSAAEVDAIFEEELAPAFAGSVSVSEALTSAAKRIDALLAKEQ